MNVSSVVFFFSFSVQHQRPLTLAKSLDGSPLTFPPSFSSLQTPLPRCKHRQTGRKQSGQSTACPSDSF